MFVYKIQANPFYTIFMTLWIGNGAVLKNSSQWQFEILKINNSWPELFNF